MHGKIVEGTLRPSSDLPTHAALYRAFPSLGGIAHTHSEYATAWAQAGKGIPCFGTTHADYFHGPIPITDVMTDAEINGDYEANTGTVIIRAFEKIDPMAVPAVLVANHAPFAWASDARKASENAWMLELVARMAYFTVGINAQAKGLGKTLHDKHFLRKHGNTAYYGQVRDKE
jgi:L-ribulose-5-phosphate 4-epimerase